MKPLRNFVNIYKTIGMFYEKFNENFRFDCTERVSNE